eukprot:CAMPEP_0202812822 /NCGR_PEP_ID=MMETSP1389-20130828/4387_1 /ASSEMBLY_ACC=CAM_ASM_000865 /TAXON_ID=302021 /ORGANISM="Rhodomonas sp., Strain CCMP768" /LENGTH=276 /DNA_ID=CAMNT_0049484299 /DNA_START=12 /DNA_END=839 /DNA_ORIENTATION=+
MISVPQLLMGLTGFGAVVGALATYTIMASTKRSRAKVKVTETSKGSNCFVPVATAKVLKAAKAVRWYSPPFSPKNVPRFYDVSSFTEDPDLFQFIIDLFVGHYEGFPPSQRPTCIVGCDARGFVLGPPIAMAMGIKFVLLRKDQKAPGVLVEGSGYSKEYAEAHDERMCLRLGSVSPKDRVVIIDDLLATGGTAIAGMEVVTALGATVTQFGAIVALEGLNGIENIRKAHGGKYKGVPIFTLFSDAMVGDGTRGDPSQWKLKGRLVPLGEARSVQE